MSAQHTQGRIYFRANGGANSYALMDQATNNWRMTILLNGEQVTAQQAADLERMAACWNACEGISTEHLEALLSHGERIVEFRRTGIDAAHGLLAQRDELLAAAKLVIAWYEAEDDHSKADFYQRMQMCRDSEEALRAAISKATGGAL